MPGEQAQAPHNLTHSLYHGLSDLLFPDKLVAATEVQSRVNVRNVQHGVYAWWFDGDLPIVPRGGCLSNGHHNMLYVGIAPPQPSGKLAGRVPPMNRRLVRNHLQGSIRTSTLRQTLAALLADRGGFTFSRDPRGKPRMQMRDEQWLSAWMIEHACLSFVHTDDPWSLEETLIRTGPSLPLNLSMSQHPFRKILSTMRSRLGRDAEDNRM